EAKFLANQDKNRAEQKKEEEELYQQLLEGSEEYLKEFNDAEDEKQKKAKETADKQKEDDEKKMERAKELRDAEIELAKQALSAVFELQNSKLEKELNDLEKKKEHELSNKNLTEAQKAKIEADFDKKAAAIKTKQAQQAKIQALFDIALGTAVSVMNAKGNVPLMIVLAAMGAVQAALVAAKPIPKYAKGTMSAADRFIAGEAGPELMFLRDRSVMLADRPTYFEGSKFKGARIFSNPETERLIGAADRRVQGHSISDERILLGLHKVEKAILSKPVNIVDSENRIIGQSISNHQEIYLNRLINRN
ncbi:MAG: hypothetical protein JZU49_01160, partial [Sulfuricurvum sp.]|nr:hypothetical protein [Sulfuricurvum sp.]